LQSFSGLGGRTRLNACGLVVGRGLLFSGLACRVGLCFGGLCGGVGLVGTGQAA